jgi:hypothetical protein
MYCCHLSSRLFDAQPQAPGPLYSLRLPIFVVTNDRHKNIFGSLSLSLSLSLSFMSLGLGTVESASFAQNNREDFSLMCPMHFDLRDRRV